MKSLYKVVAFLILATLVLSACSPATVATPAEAAAECIFTSLIYHIRLDED